MTDQPSPPDQAEQSIENLRQRMIEIEAQRFETIDERRMSDADASLVACTQTLEAIAQLCLEETLESRSVSQMLGEFLNIWNGGKISAMLAYRNGRGRPPEDVQVDDYKGRLAAMIEYLQEKGWKRADAAKWVTRHLPDRMKQALGSPTHKTVDGWLSKSGGPQGQDGMVREGYLSMRGWLKTHEPNDTMLLTWLRRMQHSLPSPEGWPPRP